MTTTATGRQAEAVAADFLASEGYKVITKNWRTRFCEIDIVARRTDSIYFVEVKYRQSDRQGGGIEYITHAKRRQMHFAAESWVAENDWAGDYQLSAIEVSGRDFQVTNFIEDI